MDKWEIRQACNGNRYDTFVTDEKGICPGQLILLYKDENGFYFTYYVGVDTVFFQERITAEDWDKARFRAIFQIEKYLEKQEMKWKSLTWHLQQRYKK